MTKSRLLPFLMSVVITASVAAQKPLLSFFRAVDTPLADGRVTDAAIGDMNNDGLPDLVVVASFNSFEVALTDRRGRLRPVMSQDTAHGSSELALADFDNDGNLDILTGPNLRVLPGGGDGTFGASLVSTGSANDALVADFDGDGITDVVSTGGNIGGAGAGSSVDVYRGKGDGTFEAFRNITISDRTPRPVAIADFDNDGRPDVALVHHLGRQLVIYRNAGDLTFVASPGFTLTEIGPSFAAAGDLDGDGHLDVVTANDAGTTSVFLGNGDATVQPGQTFSLASTPCTVFVDCPRPESVGIADVNLDGALDVVAATSVTGGAAILLGDGEGGFGTLAFLAARAFTTDALLADLDENGATDVVIINSDVDELTAGTRYASTFRNRARSRGK